MVDQHLRHVRRKLVHVAVIAKRHHVPRLQSRPPKRHDVQSLGLAIPHHGRMQVGIRQQRHHRERHPRIVGVKDATAKLDRVSITREEIGPDFIQLSGEDATALAFNVHGGRGCISVTANVAPKACAEFQAACLGHDYITALEIQDRLMPVHRALFCETSPAPVKYAASLLGLASDAVRLPLVAASYAARAQVREAMSRAGLLNA